MVSISPCYGSLLNTSWMNWINICISSHFLMSCSFLTWQSHSPRTLALSQCSFFIVSSSCFNIKAPYLSKFNKFFSKFSLWVSVLFQFGGIGRSWSFRHLQLSYKCPGSLGCLLIFTRERLSSWLETLSTQKKSVKCQCQYFRFISFELVQVHRQGEGQVPGTDLEKTTGKISALT